MKRVPKLSVIFSLFYNLSSFYILVFSKALVRKVHYSI